MVIQNDIKLIELKFDKEIYDILAIKKAAYKFSDIASFKFNNNGSYYECSINFLSEMNKDSIERFKLDFNNELLDQDLRVKINNETSEIKNVIIGYAFSKTDLQN